jgi:RecA/RadA recombinase
MEKIQTHCKAIDSLTDGGLPTGTITQIFGEKALGKSIISFQTACSAVTNGNSAIVLDTEQSYLSYLIGEGQWGEKLGKRLGKSISVEEAG